MKSVLLIATTLTIFLSGCSTTNPNSIDVIYVNGEVNKSLELTKKVNQVNNEIQQKMDINIPNF